MASASTRKSATQSQPATDRHNTARLKAQVKVQKHVEKVKAATTISQKRRALDEMAFYPAHDKRTESPEYHKVHVDLTVAKDMPCLVCGVKNSTLKDPNENHYGAKQMETHHHLIEWALANAIDVAKFNKIIRATLAARHPQTTDYQKDMNEQQVKAWIDHSPDNLWVLCDVHHRAKFLGIHEITYPIWCPMDILKSDFEGFVADQVKQAAAAKAKPAKQAKPAHSNGRHAPAP